jgi:predicted permease
VVSLQNAVYQNIRRPLLMMWAAVGLVPGFDAKGVVTATVSLQDERYRTPDTVAQLFDETLRMRELPAVESGGAALGLPYERLLNLGFKALDAQGSGAMTNLSSLTPGYFGTLRIPIVRGRDFTDAERAGAPGVAIVNQEFADRYYKGEEVVGRRIAIGGAQREIVGLVGNAQAQRSFGGGDPIAPMPLVYIPVRQTSESFLRLVHGWFSPSWAVRSRAGAAETEAALRRIVEAVDPLLPIAQVRSMSEVRDAALAQQQFMMVLVVSLGGVALIVAAIGIHGLISNAVVERTRELGIRMALGASPNQAIRAIALPGVMLSVAGVVTGSLAALAVVRLLRSFLWGVTPTDPLTFIGVALVLLMVATVSSLVPALRVLKLDPARTLRQE